MNIEEIIKVEVRRVSPAKQKRMAIEAITRLSLSLQAKDIGWNEKALLIDDFIDAAVQIQFIKILYGIDNSEVQKFVKKRFDSIHESNESIRIEKEKSTEQRLAEEKKRIDKIIKDRVEQSKYLKEWMEDPINKYNMRFQASSRDEKALMIARRREELKMVKNEN